MSKPSNVHVVTGKLRILNDGALTRIWIDDQEIVGVNYFALHQHAGELPELVLGADVVKGAEIDAVAQMARPQSEITREEQADLIAKMVSQSDGGINTEELSEREKLVMLSLVEGGTVVQYTWFDRLLLRLVAIIPGIVGGMIGCMIWQILF